MAEIRYDISQLFAAAFGVGYAKSIKYLPTGADSERPALNFEGGQIDLEETEVYSHLGTPVMFPITFKSGSYQYYEDGEILTRDMQDYTLPYTAVADFRRNKRKRSTPISGGSGSVKEVFGHSDWQVRIRGLILPEQSNRYPAEELQEFLQWENLMDVLKVEGKMFEYLNIYAIDIEDISLPKMADFPFVQAFEIRGESDEPSELIL